MRAISSNRWGTANRHADPIVIRTVRRTLHPAWYQGYGKKAPYFEGWYFKLVDPSQRHRLAVIPGIFKATNPGDSHAFVQVLEGASGEASYHEYPVEAFNGAARGLDVRIGANRFTLNGITLQIRSGGRSLEGSLDLVGLTPWPVTVISPGVMGWFAWIPFLQTYHGVLSFDHVIHGTLSVDGETVDFDGGRGYIEKDWGHSFPEAWVWMQTNHFDHLGTSLTASIATIPWLRTSFRGFIIGLWHQGHLYRFATYTGAQIEELILDDVGAMVVVSDRNHRLEIAAQGAEGGILRGPTGVNMAGRVPESLGASVTVRLSALGGGQPRLVLEGTGRSAGLEVVGDRDRLLS